MATDYICGQGNEDKTYMTRDPVLVCLFFDQVEPPVKVVFAPEVDKFEVF